MKHLCSILFLIITLSSGAQQVYYVDANQGNDSNSGLSEENAWRNFQHATSMVSPGDTVKILFGIYENQSNDNPWGEITPYISGEPGKYIVFTGISNADGQKPLIRSGSVKGIDVYNQSYLVFDNFELEPAEGDPVGIKTHPDFGLEWWRGRRAISVDGESHHVIIKNMYAHDFPGSGIGTSGDVVWFEGNIVEHCAFGANNANSGMGIYHTKNLDVPGFPEFPDHRIIFKDNISRYNINLRGFEGPIGMDRLTDGNGIIIDDNRQTQSSDPEAYLGRTLIVGNICYGNGGMGINIFQSDYVDIYNNTLLDNAQSTRVEPLYELAMPDAQLSLGRVRDVKVRNNIFLNTTSSTTTISKYEDASVIYSNNIHWGPAGDFEDVRASDIIADPLFVGVLPLTPAQTEMFGSQIKPYDESGASAQVLEPTITHHFPIHQLDFYAESPALNAGTEIEFREAVGDGLDIGAVEMQVEQVVANTQDTYDSGAPRRIVDTVQIEAETYDMGANLAAYYDVDAGEMNGCDRTDDVDISGTDNCVVTSIAHGEWLEYTLDISGGQYNIRFMVSNADDTDAIKLSIGNDPITTVNLPNTSGDEFQLTSEAIANLSEGVQTLRFHLLGSGFNLDYILFEQQAPLGSYLAAPRINIYPNPVTDVLKVEVPERSGPKNIMLHDLSGRIVFESKKLTSSSFELDTRALNRGTYILKLLYDGRIHTSKIIVR